MTKSLRHKVVYMGIAIVVTLLSFVIWQQHTRLGVPSQPDGELTVRLITRNEGSRRTVYLDALGNATIGIGHEVQKGETFTTPLTDVQINALLSVDLLRVETQAKGILGKSWVSLNTARQAVVIDMVFNLGTGGFLEFHDFIEALKKQDWDGASRAILDSLAARENPVRYHRNANVMRSGNAKDFEL